MRRLVMPVALLALAGCAAVPPPESGAETPASPPGRPQPGAIWSEDAGGLALFGDAKARREGDVLTVLLGERTQAKTSTATNIAKQDSGAIDVPAVFGRPVTRRGVDLMNNEYQAEREFSGSGDSAQSNQLTGSVTVTVVERLSNGNLRVRGEKRLRLNQGDETVRVEGVVRPADIAPDNTIASSRLAEAKISYAGHGALGEANTRGWLGRLFSTGWMPF